MSKLQICFILAGLFATQHTTLAHENYYNIDSGTCASINYSDTCCPPGANCKAADGECYCNAACHELSDCCRDVYCPPRMLKLISNQFKLFNYFTIYRPKNMCRSWNNRMLQ